MPEASDKIIGKFKAENQEQVFFYFDQLSDSQKEALVTQASMIDPVRINSIFKQATQDINSDEGFHMEPLPKNCYDDVEAADSDQVSSWNESGLEAIKNGKVAVLLLAGGQGTRLGSSAPKGCYDIGLPSHKSLFQLQAERILRLQNLGGNSIPWYVMTSGPTRAPTESFFKENNYFGLQEKDVIFFEQGVLPAFTNDGKIILEDKDKISVAPDGNGGVYAALRVSGVLADMEKRGVEFIHAYCVDNCLVKVADPVFLGYCIRKKAMCGAKVVRKAYAHEPVGVVSRVNGKFSVVEYSEISKENAEKLDENGRLAFNAANIANHYYRLDYLKQVCTEEFESNLKYHVAKKKIKHIDTATNEIIKPTSLNGIKLELFIFDIFPFLPVDDASSTPFAVLSVPRTQEFSPLKNAPGTGVDGPETSRRDLFLDSIRMIEEAGGSLKAEGSSKEKIKFKKTLVDGARVEMNEVEEEFAQIEISPLVSYAGEKLEFLKGKVIELKKPTYIANVEELKALVA